MCTVHEWTIIDMDQKSTPSLANRFFSSFFSVLALKLISWTGHMIWWHPVIIFDCRWYLKIMVLIYLQGWTAVRIKDNVAVDLTEVRLGHTVGSARRPSDLRFIMAWVRMSERLQVQLIPSNLGNWRTDGVFWDKKGTIHCHTKHSINATHICAQVSALPHIVPACCTILTYVHNYVNVVTVDYLLSCLVKLVKIYSLYAFFQYYQLFWYWWIKDYHYTHTSSATAVTVDCDKAKARNK